MPEQSPDHLPLLLPKTAPVPCPVQSKKIAPGLSAGRQAPPRPEQEVKRVGILEMREIELMKQEKPPQQQHALAHP